MVASSLAESLAAGDPAAFAALYDRLSRRLFNTALAMTASPADAEDIVHDLFVALARGRSRLGDVIDLEAYIFTMLRHAVSRRRRRAAVDHEATQNIGQERERNGTGIVSPAAMPSDDLEAAMAALPAEQREVVSLRFRGGLTFAEIAAATGTSLHTAASRYRYAMEKLRMTMGPRENLQ